MGRDIHNGIPLKFHPKIPFYVYHVPLPLVGFIIAVESPPLWPDLWVAPNISCIEMIISLLMCLRRDLVGFCSMPMKSST